MADPVTAVETWAPVPDYTGFYEVSDDGRVRSVSRFVYSPRSSSGFRWHTGKLISPFTDRDGYQRVYLYRNGESRKRGVHQLVAEAFIGTGPPGMWVLHGNGNPADNVVSNLRWDTPAENSRDRIRHGNGRVRADGARCLRGHLLVAPNLTKGDGCLACSRGKANMRYAVRTGRALDLRAATDGHYEQIMRGEPAA